MHSPAVRAVVSEIAAFRRTSSVKKHGAGFKKSNIIGGWP
jgi:hypothetical protein